MPWTSLPSWQTHIALGRLGSSVADLPSRLSKLCELVAVADPGVARSTVPNRARLPVTVCQRTILRDAIVHLLSVFAAKAASTARRSNQLEQCSVALPAAACDRDGGHGLARGARHDEHRP